jgi:Kae1-associated kinase Bud32
MQILQRGAEAILYLDKIENRKVLVKERIKKSYRISAIDERLRKERTRMEIKILTEARKCRVPTPQIFNVDEQNGKIVMEFIEGKTLKEVFEKASKIEIEKIAFEVGKLIGKLHAADIVHGDLTTSNMIQSDEKIYFIDFGLSQFSSRVEDKAVDLHLLFEALKAAHFKVLNYCWENIVKGYKYEYPKAEEVLKQVKEIEKRARYMER